jgi:hypothetical protein
MGMRSRGVDGGCGWLELYGGSLVWRGLWFYCTYQIVVVKCMVYQYLSGFKALPV